MKKEMLFETLGEVEEQYICQAHETSADGKKSPWVRFGVMAACLAVVALGVFGVLRAQETATVPEETVLHVNELKEYMSTDMDVQISVYNALSEQEQGEMLCAFEESMGMSQESVSEKMPEGYTLCEFMTVNAPTDREEGTYAPHDYVMQWKNEEGGDITMALCAFEQPLRDVYLGTEPQVSTVLGVPMVIYGYQSSYMVQFFYENVYYDVETQFLTLPELEAVLTALVG